jgi:hypothetical protein
VENFGMGSRDAALRPWGIVLQMFKNNELQDMTSSGLVLA